MLQRHDEAHAWFAGRSGVAHIAASRRELAAWFAGFALAAREARVTVSP
jgi:hypothetical protein